MKISFLYYGVELSFLDNFFFPEALFGEKELRPPNDSWLKIKKKVG